MNLKQGQVILIKAVVGDRCSEFTGGRWIHIGHSRLQSEDCNILHYCECERPTLTGTRTIPEICKACSSPIEEGLTPLELELPKKINNDDLTEGITISDTNKPIFALANKLNELIEFIANRLLS